MTTSPTKMELALIRIFDIQFRKLIEAHDADIRRRISIKTYSNTEPFRTQMSVFRRMEELLPEYFFKSVKLDLNVLRSYLSRKEFGSIKNTDIGLYIRYIYAHQLFIINPSVVELDDSIADELTGRWNLSNATVAIFIRNLKDSISSSSEFLRKLATMSFIASIKHVKAASLIEDPQITDDSKSVIFIIKRGKFSPAADSEKHIDSIDMHSLIYLSLRDIENSGTIERIHNIDLFLSNKISDYIREFENTENGGRDVVLYMMGIRLRCYFEKISSNIVTSFPDIVSQIQVLLTLHDSYIWGFARVRRLIARHQSSSRSYGINVERSINTILRILSFLSEKNELFDKDAINTLANAPYLTDIYENDPSSHPSPAIVYGIARGVLQSMGKILLHSAVISEAVFVGVMANAMSVSLNGTDILENTEKTFRTLYEELIFISTTLPNEFGWIKTFFETVVSR